MRFGGANLEPTDVDPASLFAQLAVIFVGIVVGGRGSRHMKFGMPL